jgi:TIR domain
LLGSRTAEPGAGIDLQSGAVFLSYASEDTSVAERIAGALRGAGIEVWADVPDSFSAVQWTPLPEGSPTPELIARVARLLHSPLTATTAGPSPVVDRMPAAPSRSSWWIGLGVAVTIAMAAIAYNVAPRELVVPPQTTDKLPRQAGSPAISEKSVAALPLTDMSEKHDQEYLSDRLSEELIDRLTQVRDLQVTARTSSFYFKGRSIRIADIAKALNVANVS